MSAQTAIDRHSEIAEGNPPAIHLPKFKKYAICNLRGDVGKTTLSFNIGYLTDHLLVVDTCPQGNLSSLFDSQYYLSQSPNVRDMVLPYLISGLGKATRTANFIGATNDYFAVKNSYYIRSASDLFLLPSLLMLAINQALALPSPQKEQSLDSILFSLKTEIEREMKENNLDKCLMDTSPYLGGATQLAWYAANAMIIPVRTDPLSIHSLELLINTLTSPQGEFRKYLLDNTSIIPKIQMVILTHCGSSKQENAPDKQTRIYVEKVYDILSRHRTLLSTNDPDNHLLLLDDFLGAGRISAAQSKPIALLKPGESKTIDRTRVAVNESVKKCQMQLKFITGLLW